MADQYRVLTHSITHTPVQRIDEDGDISESRHSFNGQLVELSAGDARSLVKAGAVELVKSEAPPPKK